MTSVLSPSVNRQAAAVGKPTTGLFTVDVEDWYHPLIKDPARWPPLEDRIVAPTVRLLEALERRGSHGTFFVLGVVAERHPDLVRRILDGGHEVGCHGHFHYSLQWLDPAGFREEIGRSMSALRAAGAHDVVSYRAPYFSLNESTEWALPILAEHGLVIDSSVFPMRTGYYGHRHADNRPHVRGPIYEFPVTLPTFAGMRVPLTGGFYSRFFPMSWTLASIARVLGQGAEPMFYIHPWELDPEHPRIRVGRFLTYRHYLRLARTAELLDALLSLCRWRSLRESKAERGVS